MFSPKEKNWHNQSCSSNEISATIQSEVMDRAWRQDYLTISSSILIFRHLELCGAGGMREARIRSGVRRLKILRNAIDRFGQRFVRLHPDRCRHVKPRNDIEPDILGGIGYHPHDSGNTSRAT